MSRSKNGQIIICCNFVIRFIRPVRSLRHSVSFPFRPFFGRFTFIHSTDLIIWRWASSSSSNPNWQSQTEHIGYRKWNAHSLAIVLAGNSVKWIWFESSCIHIIGLLSPINRQCLSSVMISSSIYLCRWSLCCVCRFTTIAIYVE